MLAITYMKNNKNKGSRMGHTKKIFKKRTLFEQKFSYIYNAYFSFEFLSKFGFFSKERLFERTYKNSAFRTNGVRKKKMNFVRTLFDQSTSSQMFWSSRLKLGHSAVVVCVHTRCSKPLTDDKEQT